VIPAHHVCTYSGNSNFGQGERKFNAVFPSGSKSSTSFSLSGAIVPGAESSMEQKFRGMKVPRNVSSIYGTFAPGSEST